MFTNSCSLLSIKGQVASHTWNSGREDVLVEDDEVLDKLVDQILELDLVSLLRNRDQGWAEADGQVVGVHHVLVTEK